MPLSFPSKPIWLAAHPVDFRKSIDGLCVVAIEELGRKPMDEIILFANKRRDRVKILLWDGGGFVLVYKRLDKRKITLPKEPVNDKYLLDSRELEWLLQGVDWLLPRENTSVSYASFY
tara:strand:- start:1559 stop:1912 length:354 start_codon:yes stop_codon:yes gene_type:complete